MCLSWRADAQADLHRAGEVSGPVRLGQQPLSQATRSSPLAKWAAALKRLSVALELAGNANSKRNQCAKLFLVASAQEHGDCSGMVCIFPPKGHLDRSVEVIDALIFNPLRQDLVPKGGLAIRSIKFDPIPSGNSPIIVSLKAKANLMGQRSDSERNALLMQDNGVGCGRKSRETRCETSPPCSHHKII
jgi:hypothetical protein